MRAWLKNCQVTDVAMESTGQYWRPLWNVLEGEFAQLILVNPQHIKGLNGYKTDPKDALWIAGLLEGGKLRNSWVPPRRIRELKGFDPPASQRARRPEPGEEPHRAVVPDRQYQSVFGRDRLVRSIGAADAEGDRGRQARPRLDG
jgi:transposase